MKATKWKKRDRKFNHNKSSFKMRAELERIKFKLSKIVGVKTWGTIVRSRARWYEHGERNSKYFYNLKKRNQKKKHITSLVNNVCDKITNPKDILEEEERFSEEAYTSRNMDPNCPTFNEFFETENVLSLKSRKRAKVSCLFMSVRLR